MSVGVGATVTQIPAADNRAGMTRAVLNYVQANSDPDLENTVHEALNGGVDLLNSRMWWWNIKTQDITLAATDLDYTLNSNFKKPIAAILLDTNSKQCSRLRWKEPKVFYDENTYNVSDGSPSVYSVVNAKDDGLLVLNVAPTSDFVASWPKIRLKYHARIAYLTGQATLDAPPEFRSLVVWYARWEFALIRGRSTEARAAEVAYTRWLQRLITDDNDTMTDWDT